jgi:hypothetical protein
MAILKIRDADGNVHEVLAIKGDKGDTGPMPKEEWITIADTTLTEDVASLEFTTDIDGNPFKCKKIVLQVKCPNQLTTEGEQTISFPVQSGGDAVTYSLANGAYGFVITSTIIFPNAIVKHEINRFAYVEADTLRERTRVNSNIGYFTQYGVYLPKYPIPKGSLITVWGLKA